MVDVELLATGQRRIGLSALDGRGASLSRRATSGPYTTRSVSPLRMMPAAAISLERHLGHALVEVDQELDHVLRAN